MIRFECDYAEGALPEILDLLVKTNMEQTPGYSVDVFCDRARALIKEECDAPDADVHFLVGGTGQQNSYSVCTACTSGCCGCIHRPYQRARNRHYRSRRPQSAGYPK